MDTDYYFNGDINQTCTKTGDRKILPRALASLVSCADTHVSSLNVSGRDASFDKEAIEGMITILRNSFECSEDGTVGDFEWRLCIDAAKTAKDFTAFLHDTRAKTALKSIFGYLEKEMGGAASDEEAQTVWRLVAQPHLRDIRDRLGTASIPGTASTNDVHHGCAD